MSVKLWINGRDQATGCPVVHFGVVAGAELTTRWTGGKHKQAAAAYVALVVGQAVLHYGELFCITGGQEFDWAHVVRCRRNPSFKMAIVVVEEESDESGGGVAGRSGRTQRAMEELENHMRSKAETVAALFREVPPRFSFNSQ
ncbi:hypothetical protein BGZ65_002014 [Modicella reniformis]|uniref:Uncharacterized protein n=1 Tax=Modicella reniformis TaxID=1440133 RepID=A0A9P6J4D9_9FUNG|nr:hypothetical protein BGZ65_002014 [Modicella reniformis]